MYLAVALAAGCTHGSSIRGTAEHESDQVFDAAYEGLIALEPLRRRAEAEGDVTSLVRIDNAMNDLLLLFDQQISGHGLRRFIDLGYLSFGAHDSETYDCIGIRKGPALAESLNQELQRSSNPCFADLGESSPICASQSDAQQRFRFIVAEIQREPHCELVE